MVEQGNRAVLVFCVQHSGIEHVSPADQIDPVYGNTLRQAIKKGVEVIAYKAHFSLQGASHEITLVDAIPVII
jgi:sugar fermentation stimulation protein A